MKPFDAEQLMEKYDNLPKFSDEEAREILSHVVVIKLNGGLGTTMGKLLNQTFIVFFLIVIYLTRRRSVNSV